MTKGSNAGSRGASPKVVPEGRSGTSVASFSGVAPHLAVSSATSATRSEAGIGALMPWADKLWFISYTSVGPNDGRDIGLYSLDATMALTRHPESVVGTFANRMIHAPTSQLIIGPHLIDDSGRVRTIDGLRDELLTATFEHLTDPANLVYFLSMNGSMFEADVRSLRVRKVFDLAHELKVPGEALEPHFKGGFTGNGRVVVATNSYGQLEFEGKIASGRLAEWDGNEWTTLEASPFYEVTGRDNMGQVMFATGWDRSSALLKVFAEGRWTKYRLPKATHCFDHQWQTEWPRIREIESERYLMDCHGMFYELSPVAYSGSVWGVRPISTHLRIIPDFCSWRGLLVLAGNQTTPIHEHYLFAGQPQAGLWFGKSDDLWQFGKPSGWGGPWWETPVEASQPSDPYLMTGFEHKVLHLVHSSESEARFLLEVDFMGNGAWQTYAELQVPPRGYIHHEFPAGFSAHWIRLTSDLRTVATAQFTYT